MFSWRSRSASVSSSSALALPRRNLLKIKPVLELDKEGYIVTKEKIRTYSKAIETLIELVLEQIKDQKRVIIFGFHSLKEDTIKEVLDKIKEARPDIESVEVHYITPAVGAHIGAGVIGVGSFIL